MASSPEDKCKDVIPVPVWPCGEGTSSSGAGSREGLLCSGMAASPPVMGVIPVGPGEGTSSSGAKGSHKRKRVEIKKWNAVAWWRWDVEVANCAICRNHIMDHCIDVMRLIRRTALLHGELATMLFISPALVEDTVSLPSGQQRVGVLKVWPLVNMWHSMRWRLTRRF